jgi:hypothetical protein
LVRLLAEELVIVQFVLLLEKLEDIESVVSGIEHSNFLFVHHAEGVNGMFELVLIENPSQAITMIQGVPPDTDHSQEDEGIVNCGGKIEYVLKRFG